MNNFMIVLNILVIPAIGCLLFSRKRKNFMMHMSIALFLNYFVSKIFAMAASRVIRGEVTPPMRKFLPVALASACIVPFLMHFIAGVMKKRGNVSFDEKDEDSEISEKKVASRALEWYFLFVIAFVSFGIQIGLTTFRFGPEYYLCKHIYIITAFAVLIKIASDYKNRILWISFLPSMVFYMAFPFEHYNYQAFYALLIIGCVGIKWQKILYAAVIPAIVVIADMIMAGLGGAIDSMSYFARDMRSCWGHVYPTDFGTAILFIAITIWVILKDVPDVVFLIPAAVSYFISTSITRSFTSEYLTVIFIGVIIARMIGREVIEKRGKLKWIPKIVNVLTVSAFPVLGLIMLFLVFAYAKEKNWALNLDILMHSRLVYPAKMYAKYGLKPFGTFFDMIGNGGSVIANQGEYNFLDSTYPQILIRYGWVTYITACGLWVWTTWRAIKSGNRRMAMAMALFSVDFIMEHHWYELCYNPFIIMPFADFAWGVKEKAKCIVDLNECNILKKFFKGNLTGNRNLEVKNSFTVDEKKPIVHRIVFWGVFALQFLICFLVLPFIFSWMRTIFHGCGLYGGGDNGKIVFAIITVFLGATLLVMWNLSRIIAFKLCQETSPRRNTSFLLFGIAVLFALALIGNNLINKVGAENADRIEQNRKVLEIAAAHADGKVYVNMLPEAYIRCIRGLSRSYMNGHDYGRYSNATVLTDADWDSTCLTGEGFLYLQISENDAIYTNDSGVIDALREEGYILKGYNSYVHQVDMENMARMNDVVETEDGLLLEGVEHQIIHGPYLELASGLYTAEFELKLLNLMGDAEKKVCGIRIAAYSGESIKAEVNVYESDFDEEGKVSYKIPFWGDGQGFEFLVFTEEDMRCIVSSITYQRTPDFDTHIKVDSEGRIIHEEYYDVDGNPKQMTEGYYGKEYEYDDNDLQIMVRFLGSDYNPMVISWGFAEAHREYDEKKRCIGEKYYGLNEEPIIIPGGYAGYKQRFDDIHNVVHLTYLGTDGNPIVIDQGYSIIHKYYNDQNQLIREEYYDVNDEKMTRPGGQFAVEHEYDEAGNCISDVYYGINNEKILVDGTLWKVLRSYDENNRLVHEEYFGTDGELILVSGTYAMVDFIYDDNGNLVKKILKDTAGEVVAEENL